MKNLYILSLAYFIHIIVGYSQPSVTNPTFTTDASGWTDCQGTGAQPEHNSESVYGGSTSDVVVEVDNGNTLGLCQSISGFTVGQSYTLYIPVSRRTTTGQGGNEFAPNPTTLLLSIGSVTNYAITRNNTTFGYTQFAITFTATATTQNLAIGPDPSAWSSGGGASTYGMIIKGISFSSILPVELFYFTAVKNGSEVNVNWQTAAEKNNHYFIVEKSKNGADFITLDSISGAGNSVSQLSYHTTDPTPYTGISYYRLKQVDFDGKTSYSKIKAVRFDGKGFIVYPNPGSGIFNILGLEGETEIAVLNVLGETILTKKVLPILSKWI